MSPKAKSERSASKPVALPILPIVTWNPTKVFAYEECPQRTQWKYARKLCPLCFTGTVGFDAPCDTCGKKADKGPALQRGIDIDTALTAELVNPIAGVGKLKPISHTFPNTLVTEIVHELTHERLLVLPKHPISLDREWRVLPKFTKGPWFWGELDVLVLDKKKRHARVIDWKSGGIDKKTGQPRENEHYQDQLEIYAIAVLCANPEVRVVDTSLVFVDAARSPEVKGRTIRRKDLVKLKAKWVERLTPMFCDTVFAPRPGWGCRFCDYRNDRGGPCAY